MDGMKRQLRSGGDGGKYSRKRAGFFRRPGNGSRQAWMFFNPEGDARNLLIRS
jgi:hypothetical protein